MSNKMPEETLNDKKDIYNLSLTEWERDAIQQILINGNYTGKDIPRLAKLMVKIKDLKKDK